MFGGLFASSPCGGAVPPMAGSRLTHTSSKRLASVSITSSCTSSATLPSTTTASRFGWWAKWCQAGKRQKSDWMGWRLDCWRELSDRQSLPQPGRLPLPGCFFGTDAFYWSSKDPSHGRKGHFFCAEQSIASESCSISVVLLYLNWNKTCTYYL